MQKCQVPFSGKIRKSTIVDNFQELSNPVFLEKIRKISWDTNNMNCQSLFSETDKKINHMPSAELAQRLVLVKLAILMVLMIYTEMHLVICSKI